MIKLSISKCVDYVGVLLIYVQFTTKLYMFLYMFLNICTCSA